METKFANLQAFFRFDKPQLFVTVTLPLTP